MATTRSVKTIGFLDGGLSSLLEQQVGQLHPKLWSAALLAEQEGNKHIKQAHQAFLAGGANIITTVSYQATTQGLMEHLQLSEQEAETAIINSVKLGREAIAEKPLRDDAIINVSHRATQEQSHQKSTSMEASSPVETWLLQQIASKRTLVAASIGPYGAFLADGSEYRGGYAVEPLDDFHASKARLLARAAPDLLAFETIPQLSEAMIIAQMMARELPDFPYWLSFQCQDEHRTAAGDDIVESTTKLVSMWDESRAGHLIGVGVNCMSPAIAAALVANLSRAVGARPLAILCYPNKGEEWDAKTKQWGQAPKGDAADVTSNTWLQQLLQAGCTIVGGCCRVWPEDIASIVKNYEAISQSNDVA
eukprot:m.166423 g.166423  ORF g.166423 m.166423 type:complete len:364 (-) comp16437_c0_seq4:1620-2711(-)